VLTLLWLGRGANAGLPGATTRADRGEAVVGAGEAMTAEFAGAAVVGFAAAGAASEFCANSPANGNKAKPRIRKTVFFIDVVNSFSTSR
jgi:hypothetical protein